MRHTNRHAGQSGERTIANALALPAGRLLLAGVFAVVEVMLVIESAVSPLTKLRRI